MIICDLHTHSTASDGKYSPKDVVRKAYDRVSWSVSAKYFTPLS